VLGQQIKANLMYEVASCELKAPIDIHPHTPALKASHAHLCVQCQPTRCVTVQTQGANLAGGGDDDSGGKRR